MPKLKDIKSLAITWSPAGNTVRYGKTLRRHLENYLISLKNVCSKIEINPELNTNGNLHYHITADVTDVIGLYKRVIPPMKRDGIVNIKRIYNQEGQNDYVEADHSVMLEILDMERLPITRQDLIDEWARILERRRTRKAQQMELSRKSLEKKTVIDRFINGSPAEMFMKFLPFYVLEFLRQFPRNNIFKYRVEYTYN